MDLRRFQRLFQRERRHDARQPLGHHALARAWWPNHEQVMSTGRRDFHRAPGVVLPLDLGEIVFELLVRGEERGGIFPHRREFRRGVPTPQKFEDLAQTVHAVNLDPSEKSGLARIGCGHEQPSLAPSAGLAGNGQHAAHRAHRSVQREFAHEHAIPGAAQIDFFLRCHHAHRNGQIETRALFLDIRRREVDGATPSRPAVSAVGNRRRHPVLALLHGGIGQPHHHDERLAPGGIDLDLHLVGIDPLHRRRINFCQHGFQHGQKRSPM